MQADEMSLAQFFTRLDGPDRSLVVANRDAPEQLQTILAQTFEGQRVDVTADEVPDEETDTVLLVEHHGDRREVVATSPLSALERTILLVNSDLYKTGTRPFTDFDLPDVLAGLDDVPFRLRGYPESNDEKLLLIVISRHIEHLAWRTDGGRLRSSFQRLSRIDDERGTRTVYQTMGESAVQTHVYGVPDWYPPAEFGVVAHGGYTDEFHDSWFVVHTPPDDSDTRPAALVALEVEPRVWDGFWTFQPDLVADIDAYIARNL